MKTALITGCSSGFGLLTAATLAKNGFRTFATMRDLGKRGRLDAALAGAGTQAEALALDVTDADSIAAAVAKAMADAGRIDLLVNNAGVGIAGFIEDLTIDEYRRPMETNFFGLVAVTKAVLPIMRRQRSGRIVNISSIGGRAASSVFSAYCASKFAVEGFCEALALEAQSFGVQVVLIEPGAFRTEIYESNRRFAAAHDPRSPYARASAAIEERADRMAARMKSDPQKVADAVLHAATVEKPRLRYLVGAHAKARAFLHALGFRVYSAAMRRLLDHRALAALIGSD